MQVLRNGLPLITVFAQPDPSARLRQLPTCRLGFRSNKLPCARMDAGCRQSSCRSCSSRPLHPVPGLPRSQSTSWPTRIESFDIERIALLQPLSLISLPNMRARCLGREHRIPSACVLAPGGFSSVFFFLFSIGSVLRMASHQPGGRTKRKGNFGGHWEDHASWLAVGRGWAGKTARPPPPHLHPVPPSKLAPIPNTFEVFFFFFG